jgi:DNA-binding CsgD family transcriptional regulator
VVLVGRAHEFNHLGALLDDARLGRARAVVVAGEAGIGKTSLLGAAVSIASDFQVFRARGVESEGALSYAVMAELLDSGRQPLLAELPRTLRLALEGACSMRSAKVDVSTVAAAWTTLLAAAAEDKPVLVLVDDIQWVDGDSAGAILFAARRVHDAQVATLLAVREPADSAVALDGLDRLELAPLDAADARLVAAGAPDSVIEAAAGNPLALVELARHRTLGDGEGTVGELLFGARVDGLSEEARQALLAAALDTSGSADVVAGAAGGRKPVEELRRNQLVSVRAGELELRHPLLRSLMLARSWDDERREVHERLADALPVGADQTRHRALAATEPDAALADDLETLAARTAGRAGSTWLLRRSAELTPDGERRPARLLAAARASFDVRDIVTARRLAADAREEGDATTRADLNELDARLALADGARIEGARALRSVAVEITPAEPERAVRLFVTAAYFFAQWGEADEALRAVDEARALRTEDPVLELLIASAHADAVAAAGEFVRAQQLFRELAELADREPAVHTDRDARLVLVEALYDGGLLERARQVVVAAERDARADGALGELHVALACRFGIELAAGRIAAADAAAAEELELAAGFGRAAERREALGHVAWGDAFIGREDECRAHVQERLRLSEEAGVSTAPHAALGLLELGLGNFAAAADVLRASESAFVREGRNLAASLRPCTADLVEALLRAGAREEAAVVLAELDRDATRLERPLAQALVQRGRGLLAGDDSFEVEFEQSLELDLLEPSPFERARTQLCWGERLRRVRRRAEARIPLRAACEAFAASGATLWLARAEAELAATGERARKRGAGSGSELTPQEQRIAVLVSDGLTNREVAARLFVSTNTVETHLRHVFQKLGVRSRTELAKRFTDFRDSNEPVAS